MKILIVDDSKAMRMIVSRTLKLAGFGGHEYREASDGRQALDIANEWKPDVILSDWNMPNMNGLQLLQTLKEMGNSSTFGFITTEGSPQMRQLAKESGAEFLITKPFTPQVFKETLQPYLGG